MPSLPPFLFAARTQAERRHLAQLKREGRIRPVGPRLYTSLPEDRVAAAARGAWASIVAALFPDALISHRTALEFTPSPEGVVFLTSTRKSRRVHYPGAGLTLQFLTGPGARADDPRFLGLRVSSRPRAFLENLQRDARDATPRALPREELERKLEQLLRDGGEPELNQLRDDARALAEELGWSAEQERLDAMIGALLGTRSADHLESAAARARSRGEPYDPACLERLHLLVAELRTRALRSLPDDFAAPDHFRNKAFFEAYFSNYIEGTTFELEEAEIIVFDHRIPASRPADAHDIVGTFTIVSDPTEMRRTPASAGDLIDLLRTRHATMLARRPDVRPGEFKQARNRAGDTHFVLPEYVLGTLRQGHALYADLDPGLPRAIFLMFLVTDVHPFDDGNGRIARVMMNAELVAAGTTTIIIPTVYREDYLTALRALTRRHRATPLVDALARAMTFSHLEFAPYPRVLAELQRRNWFRDPADAKIIVG